MKHLAQEDTVKLAIKIGFKMKTNQSPTQSELQEYYRDIHNMHCFIGFRPNIKKWDSHTYNLKISGKEYAKQRPLMSSLNDVKYDTYEDALENALLDIGHKLTDDRISLIDFEYEMFINDSGTPFEMDTWIPIATDRIKDINRIDEYIQKGLIRKLKNTNQ